MVKASAIYCENLKFIQAVVIIIMIMLTNIPSITTTNIIYIYIYICEISLRVLAEMCRQ
jgi:hypothetical protein